MSASVTQTLGDGVPSVGEDLSPQEAAPGQFRMEPGFMEASSDPFDDFDDDDFDDEFDDDFEEEWDDETIEDEFGDDFGGDDEQEKSAFKDDPDFDK